MYKKIIITLLLVLPLGIRAQSLIDQFDIKGFVDTYHAVRTEKSGDLMSSRTRLRAEVSKSFDRSSFFLSFNLNQNSLLKDRNGFELREAYFDYTSAKWNLRAGRQIIIWGAADGVRVTDQISPMDMSEFLARDYDDIRMPVEALKLSYFLRNIKVELIYIPIFKSFILANGADNPWSFLPQRINGDTVLIQKEIRPSKTLKNGEIGARIAFNLPSIDFSISALHTFNKMPVYTQKKNNESLLMFPSYHRMTMIGADLSKPLGNFVFRFEAAYNINKAYVSEHEPTNVKQHNVINALLGLDWYAVHEWTLSCQFNRDYKQSLLTANFSKKLLNSSLKLSNFLYYDLTNNSLFNRFSGDYELTDQIHLIAGYDLFHGNKGLYGRFKHNSELFFKAKYSF